MIDYQARDVIKKSHIETNTHKHTQHTQTERERQHTHKHTQTHTNTHIKSAPSKPQPTGTHCGIVIQPVSETPLDSFGHCGGYFPSLCQE